MCHLLALARESSTAINNPHDLKCITEIMVGRSNMEMQQLKSSYIVVSRGRTIEQDVKDGFGTLFSGSFRHLLIALSQVSFRKKLCSVFFYVDNDVTSHLGQPMHARTVGKY